MTRARTPQDKKARALAHDRRNVYGEHDKSSRTAIRQRKRLANRLLRQALRAALVRSTDTAEDAGVDVPRPRGRWRKLPDSPLGDVLYLRRLHRLMRDLRPRVAADPTLLDRLESAAVARGLDELAARMILRQLRADLLTWRRGAPRIPGAALELLHDLVRRLA